MQSKNLYFHSKKHERVVMKRVFNIPKCKYSSILFLVQIHCRFFIVTSDGLLLYSLIAGVGVILRRTIVCYSD